MCPAENIIDDEEWLYRSFPVPDTRGDGMPKIHFAIIDGRLRLGRGAWNDVSRRPSVDRAKMVSPEQVVFNNNDSKDAVVKLQAREIRSISGTPLLATDQNGRVHNVIFDKQDKRPGHSLIISVPPFAEKPNAEKNRWKAFQALLSLAAAKHGWVIEPGA